MEIKLIALFKQLSDPKYGDVVHMTINITVCYIEVVGADHTFSAD